jgi:hypothetical protein
VRQVQEPMPEHPTLWIEPTRTTPQRQEYLL